MTAALLVSLLLAAPPAAAVTDPLAPPPEQAPPPDVAPPAAAAPPVALPAGRTPQPQLPAPPRPKLGPLRLAVLDPRPTGDIPARPLAAFSSALVPEIRKLEAVSAIGMAEVRDMLGFERQRQLLGCSADEGCLAEIAGSLGVDEIVSSELVLVGKSYTLSVRRLDMRKAKVVQGDSRTFAQRDGEELLTVVGPTIAALFPDRPLREGKTRGIDRSVIRRLNPPPLPRWVFIVTGGAALGAAVAGGGYQLMAMDAKRSFDGLVSRSRSEPVAAGDLATAASRVRSREQTRDVLLFTALGLGVAAGVEGFFTDWRNDRATTVLPVASSDGGGVVVARAF